MFKRNSLMRPPNSQTSKREMSLEKQEKTYSDVKLITHTALSTRLHVLTKGVQAIPVPPNPTPTPNQNPPNQSGNLTQGSTLLWGGILTDPVGIKKKHLVFKSIEYIISNWSSDQFPNVIYITCDGVSGYRGKSMLVTQRVAALQLQSVTAVMDQSQVRTYQLRYVNRDPQTWEVPLTLVNIALRVTVDQSVTPITMPLPNPMLLNFQIRTE